jgi:2-polyprenyl-3-methyl-5-hydroxy-6-metoxy-1,4-benzoquinol methylase
MLTFLPTIRERDQQPELMDQPGLDAEPHHQALRGLSRLNWLSCSDGILWHPLVRLAHQDRARPLRVLDIACGGGDVLLRLHRRARRAGLAIDFAGADVSDTALMFARRNAKSHDANMTFFRLDALSEPLPSDYDVITCSLFLHHLQADQAEDLLRNMAQAARSTVLVNDLIRSHLGYVLAYLGTRFFSLSAIVHQDGLQSVRAAFTIAEATQLADRAGLTNAEFSWHWPFRFRLQWTKRHPHG